MTTETAELELLLELALTHTTSREERARIDGDAVRIPFDVVPDDRPTFTRYELVRTRGELLEALGY